MNIPEEAIAAASLAIYQRISGNQPNTIHSELARAALEAAAPLIAEQAALTERVKIVGDIRAIAESIRRDSYTPSAGVALGSIVDDVADRINVVPNEDEERKCPECGHAKRWHRKHRNGRCAGDFLACACSSGVSE